MDIDRVNSLILDFQETLGNPCTDFDKINYHVGVDLGTANLVIAVVDALGKPLGGAIRSTNVVKDGIVVDFIGAMEILRDMKAEVEKKLGITIEKAATAIPPGVDKGCIKAIVNVIEGADIDVTEIIDEPTAASKVLKISEGAVVDVGGGTTGISILRDGDVVFTADEPTGGTHMSLVVAGSMGISFEEAEKIKKDSSREGEIFAIVRPVVEKMATIVERHIKDRGVRKVYLVGGACTFSEFSRVFEKELEIEVVKTAEPLLVTPLGIALSNMR